MSWSIVSLPVQAYETVAIAELLPTANQEQIDSIASSWPELVIEGTQVGFCQSLFALQKDNRVVLVDAGIPTHLAENLLPNSLAENAISTDDVDMVILTHRDGDHVGGTLTDGKPTFKNARYIMPQAEFEAFRADPSRRERFVQFVEPLDKLGVLELTDLDAIIEPGIRLLPTPGHRFGAVSVLVDEAFLAVGDTWHVALQVLRPDWSSGYDEDKELAAQTRKWILEQAATNDWLVGVPHTPVNGLGRIRVQDASYIWVAELGLG